VPLMPEHSCSSPSPIRVMVVDDSAVIRGFLTRFIESEPDIKVITSASNGQFAVSSMGPGKFDVVVLDIEMPVMDGMTALPLILRSDPDVQVLIASTLTKANAAITIRALQAGAAECLAKPSTREMLGLTAFREDLTRKVKTLGLVARRKRGLIEKPAAVITTAKSVPQPSATQTATQKNFHLRPEIIKIAPDAIAIGSSTGGPQALMQFFSDLKGGVRQPIFVTQHMPAMFTAILAEHIAKQSGLLCHEARDGETVEGGHIYLAPGNFHMTVKAQDGKKVIALNQDTQENFCRPAVDPMLRSLVNAYGRKILAVIFTGMGSDGMKGCQQIVESGGTVLAQDEPSSVVWGMPGAVAMAGICTQVLPLGEMAKAVREYAGRGGFP
jgi:two-component system chemotaxis response regulator CheB